MYAIRSYYEYQSTMNSKWSGLEQNMKQSGIDTMLITDPKHVYYLTGFLSDPHERFLGAVLQTGHEPFLLVPALDEEAARAASDITDIITHQDTDNPYQILAANVITSYSIHYTKLYDAIKNGIA